MQRIVKYWNKIPSSIVSAPLVNSKFGERLSPSPQLLPSLETAAICSDVQSILKALQSGCPRPTRLQRSPCYGFKAVTELLVTRARMPVLCKRQQLSTVLPGQTLIDPSHCRTKEVYTKTFSLPSLLYLHCILKIIKKLFNSPAGPWLAFGWPEIQ